MVMAHELTHALEDQHFKIEPWVKAARPNEDAELARDAVLEGSAMAAMVDYLMLSTGRSLKGFAGFRSQHVDWRPGQHADAAKSPTVSQGHSDFPLHRRTVVLGGDFEKCGLAALPGVFEKPPVSTQQVLHPALYRSEEFLRR